MFLALLDIVMSVPWTVCMYAAYGSKHQMVFKAKKLW
jgi:hypothetical protein